MLGSTTRLQQVFLNLFMNARDAMPGGGMLEVRTGAHNGSVEIEVTDTGAGIPAEHLHRIFDPFFTTKGHRKGHRAGSFGELRNHQGTRGQSGRALHARKGHIVPAGISRSQESSPCLEDPYLLLTTKLEIREGLEALLTSEGFDGDARGDGRGRVCKNSKIIPSI